MFQKAFCPYLIQKQSKEISAIRNTNVYVISSKHLHISFTIIWYADHINLFFFFAVNYD